LALRGERSAELILLEFSGNEWSESATIDLLGFVGNRCGRVAFGSDFVVVTAPGTGEARVITMDSGCDQFSLRPSGYEDDSRFGASVAVVGDRVVVGDYGAVWLFARSPSGYWALVSVRTAEEVRLAVAPRDDADSWHSFGLTVAGWREGVLVGGASRSLSGRVISFGIDLTGVPRTIVPPIDTITPIPGDRFPPSLAAEDDMVVVGMPNQYTDLYHPGRVAIFSLHDGLFQTIASTCSSACLH
jgi:hypothetical protein